MQNLQTALKKRHDVHRQKEPGALCSVSPGVKSLDEARVAVAFQQQGGGRSLIFAPPVFRWD